MKKIKMNLCFLMGKIDTNMEIEMDRIKLTWYIKNKTLFSMWQKSRNFIDNFLGVCYNKNR